MNTLYSNLQCLHGDAASTEYCSPLPTAPFEDSTTAVRLSFCANFGTCNSKITHDEPHPGCKCRLEYEGTYCQFLKNSIKNDAAVKGSIEDDDFELLSSSNYTTEDYMYTTGEIFLIFICSFIILCYFYPGSANINKDVNDNDANGSVATTDESESLKTRIELV